MNLTLDQFQFLLPPELIAQTPQTPREKSRLLVLNRQTKDILDTTFDQLPSFFQPHDLIVRNQSKVIPARLIGRKPTGGKIEVLLHQALSSSDKNQQIWSCLIKPGIKNQTTIAFAPNFSATLSPTSPDSDHQFEITFPYSLPKFWQLLEKYGQPPLPPYIHVQQSALPQHRKTYQTHYALDPGSVAAPTAGLHFSPELDNTLTQRKIEIAPLTLHVGWGTFLPVKTQTISQHQMHFEQFTLPESTINQIQAAKKRKNRVVAVGTTTTRVLETMPLKAGSGATNLYVYPPSQFKTVDALITNFHLPKSTLLMLVAAFTSYPNTKQHFTAFEKSLIGRAYRHAIQQKYRFYSYGDAMLIL